MSGLSEKKCLSCSGELSRLEGKELEKYKEDLGGKWKVINEYYLEKEYSFKDFKEALDFTIKVGNLAEKEGHHPDIHLSWGKVRIIIWTHKINGLTESDFILAAKCDKLK